MIRLDYASRTNRQVAAGFEWTSHLTWAVASSAIGVACFVSSYFSDDVGFGICLLLPIGVAVLTAQAIFAWIFTLSLVARWPIGLLDLVAIVAVWMLGPAAVFASLFRGFGWC